MQTLKDQIKNRAKHIGNGIIKVDSFLNHQIDPVLMQSIGKEFAARLINTKPTKILTAEASGIAPALATSMCLEIPMIFARKHRPKTMGKQAFREKSFSPTHEIEGELMVSTEYLTVHDQVLIIDDFLATATTIQALVKLIAQSGASLVGIGAVIEKTYAGGRSALGGLNVPVEILASISGYEGDRVIFSD